MLVKVFIVLLFSVFLSGLGQIFKQRYIRDFVTCTCMATYICNKKKNRILSIVVKKKKDPGSYI